LAEITMPGTEAEIAVGPTRGELTVRALIAAAIVAALMGVSYPYMVLKLGFGPNVSVVAAFFGFIILNVIGRKSYDRWQNNIVQTAGTSASQTAFMCILLAAFDMLRSSKIVSFHLNPTPMQTFVWLSITALLGTLLSVPMRRHFIVDEKLPFPDGIAAAETLIVLDPPRGVGVDNPEWKRARQAAKVLGIGLLLAGLLMLFREDAKIFHLIPEGWDPGALVLGVAGAGFVVANMGVGVSYSLLSVGTGMLVGFRVTFWMAFGAAMGWVVFPYFLVTSGVLHDHPTRTQVLYWIMWPATGMLLSAGLTALALRWRSLADTFRSLFAAQLGEGEFPLPWVLGGVIVLSIALCIVQYVVLGMPVWVTLVAIVLSIPLMLVGLRVMGETNWGPISVMINMMQAAFAALVPGNVLTNIVTAGTTGSIATSSEGLLQDYKAGDIIGSTPKLMTIVQLLAVPIGAGAVSLVYPALVKTYGIVGDKAQLAAPSARRMAGFAELLNAGISKLPSSALWAMAIAVILGIVLAVLEDRPALRRWLPSTTGLSLGALLPFSAVATMLVGALIGMGWMKASPRGAEENMVPLASGFIAGEALIAVIVPVLLWMGLGYK
jgi:uncharacterized oligopeptide transporter (OPT) family protein